MQTLPNSWLLALASSSPAVATGARSSLKEFEAWATKAGITWDKSLIQLRAGDGDGDGTVNGDGGGGGGASATERDQPTTGAAPPSDAPWAVYAVTDIPEGRVLATIPRHAVLSAANSGLADILAAERLGGGLALVAAVMYEAARGPRSKWYGYLSSLPHREYLPQFWSEEQLRQLEGTDIAEEVRADRVAMAADFLTELAPLLGRYPARLGPLKHGWNLGAFLRAASWVASRAFYVDEHHGDALVPLADVFNHKAARVDLKGRGGGWAEGLEVAEHADVGRQQRGGGAERGATAGGRSSGRRKRRGKMSEEEEEDEEESEGEGEEEAAGRGGAAAELDRDSGDDGSEPWPPPPPPPTPARTADAGADGGDGRGRRGAAFSGRWGLLAEEAASQDGGRNLHLDIGICAVEREGCEVLDIVAAQPLAAGGEVFNTYGEHGNDELVNKYGFALPYNPFNEVSLDKGMVLEAAVEEVGAKATQKRVRFLEKHSELLAEDEEPFLLLPPRHVSTALYVALRVLAADARQMAAWGSIEDALVPLWGTWQRERQQQQQQQQQQPDATDGGDAAPDGRAKRLRGSEAQTDAGDGGGGDGDGDGDEGQRPEKRAKKAGAAAAPAAAAVSSEQDSEMSSSSESGSGSSSSEESKGGGGNDDDDDDDDDDSEDDDMPEDVEIQAPKPGSGAVPKASAKAKSEAKGAQKAKARRLGKAGAAAVEGAGAVDGRGGAEGDAAEPLWTDGMWSLLRRVVSERLSAYPTTLEEDEQALRNPSAEESAPEGKGDKAVQGTKQKGAGVGSWRYGGTGLATGGKDSGDVGGTPAEAAVARRCALLLRLGEKRLLTQTLQHLGAHS